MKLELTACSICLTEHALLLQVKFEPAAPVGTTPPSDEMQGKGQEQPVLFPHLYGTIDLEAVTAEHAVDRDGHSGEFLRIHDVT